MLKKLFVFCSFSLLLLSSIPGCGGGTRGTGGVQLSGLVVNQTNLPLPNVIIDIPQTGESTTTNRSGQFQLAANVEPGELIIVVTTKKFSTEVNIGQINPTTVTVSVKLKVNEELDEVETDSVDIRDDDSHDGADEEDSRKTPTPRSTAKHNATKTPTAAQTPGNAETPSPTPTSTATSDNDDDNDGSNNDGEDAEAEGTIQAISATSITVRNKMFTITGSTKFVDHDDHTIPSSHFTVGKDVHVKGEYQNGVAVAKTIKLTD